jgi:formylglycine-generating enzyme required for sulfatase activity
MLVLLTVIGCGGQIQSPKEIHELEETDQPEETANPESDSASTDSAEGPEVIDTADEEPCPLDMVLIGEQFCIDRFECAVEELTDGVWQPASPYQTIGEREIRAYPANGIHPQGYISGEEAAMACEAAEKRLCSSEEWLAACQGSEGRTYPYGNNHQQEACNDDYPGGHPVVDFFGTSEGIWDGVHMNDPGINQQPDSLAAGGEFADCVTGDGVHDLHGNLHEWVADSSGIFRGGFYADASINGEGCGYRTTAHTIGYHDYSTGFRCCAEPQ